MVEITPSPRSAEWSGGLLPTRVRRDRASFPDPGAHPRAGPRGRGGPRAHERPLSACDGGLFSCRAEVNSAATTHHQGAFVDRAGQVEVPVWVASPGGVVPDHGRLDLLDGYLYLPSARPDPGGRVLSDPVDDLDRGPVLCFVQCRRDLRMQRRRQGPGLGSVDRDLDEPQRVRVLADPTFL